MISKAISVPLKFGGGLNTAQGPLTINDNQSPNCKNVYSDIYGVLKRRAGFETLGTASSGTTGNGIYDYWKDASTHYLIAYIDTNLYKIDAVSNALDGTLDSISFGTGMSDDKMEFEQFNDGGTNYLIMATHSRDKLQKYDGTTCTDLSADADLPLPKYIRQWKGFLFCANIASYESRVYYNDVSGSIIGATDWSSTAYQDIRTNDGDFITALVILKGRLYSFKRYSIHRWTYLGGTPLFSIKTAVSGIGTISSKSIAIVNHPKHGEILIFLGMDGRFYGFNGSEAWPLSANIELDNGVAEFSLGRLSRNYLGGVCAANYKKRHWLVCWVPFTTYNNVCIIYDYHADTWWPFNGIEARCAGIIENIGEQNLYFIEDEGKVQRFDYGNDDDGADITGVYDTKRLTFDNHPMLKAQKEIDLHFKNIGNIDMTFRYRNDWGLSWFESKILNMSGGGFILGASELGVDKLGGPEGVRKVVNLPITNQAIQCRFTTTGSNAPWQIFGADFVTSGRGYGRSG